MDLGYLGDMTNLARCYQWAFFGVMWEEWHFTFKELLH